MTDCNSGGVSDHVGNMKHSNANYVAQGNSVTFTPHPVLKGIPVEQLGPDSEQAASALWLSSTELSARRDSCGWNARLL